MIPILFEKTETDFTSNGITRLHDCISCIVTEERNGIYEADFEFPINGAHYNEITLGRIIGVTHDESGDIQPFDIVSYSKPINGIVTFHCTHISYRQSYLTTYGTYIQNIVAAFDMLSNAQPSNPFTYVADYYPTAYMSAGDGLPHTVRELLGGIQGSILDTYGGEYEWDKWTVYWHRVRGKERDFSIRYGVNMLDYNDETSIQGAFSTCIPFWTDGAEKVVGLRTWSDGVTVTDRGECVPLDLSDKFEAMPSVADLDSAAKVYMDTHNTYIPTQSIHVEFVRLQDLGYADFENLLECDLCDTINVIFPDYNSSGRFKIVKVVWDVLRDRYESMELGDLSVTLAEALGVSQGTEKPSGAADFVTEQGTSGIWTYRKWNSGIAECWGSVYEVKDCTSAWGSVYDSGAATSQNFPSGLFASAPTLTVTAVGHSTATLQLETSGATLTTRTCSYYYTMPYSATGIQATVNFHAVGRWR